MTGLDRVKQSLTNLLYLRGHPWVQAHLCTRCGKPEWLHEVHLRKPGLWCPGRVLHQEYTR